MINFNKVTESLCFGIKHRVCIKAAYEAVECTLFITTTTYCEIMLSRVLLMLFLIGSLSVLAIEADAVAPSVGIPLPSVYEDVSAVHNDNGHHLNKRFVGKILKAILG
uniref:Secreted protein n=1 Tax=Panagrellus redivivus TaxID=6233 RepID=A0A7E4V831_PANRE